MIPLIIYLASFAVIILVLIYDTVSQMSLDKSKRTMTYGEALFAFAIAFIPVANTIFAVVIIFVIVNDITFLNKTL